MMRGVFFLPSLATLGNALCGFAALYVCTLSAEGESDKWARMFAEHKLLWAAYLVFAASIFDVLDGRLARLTRHTTDFGGQLDSLADVISFGVAPAFIALQLFKTEGPSPVPIPVSRLVWAIGALYVACTAMRLARFNVTNEHGEQHHRSFQGLPSPAAGLAVLSLVLLHGEFVEGHASIAFFVVCMVPALLFIAAILMVSEVRYPHLINTAFKGRKSIWKLVAGLMIALLLVVRPSATVAIACLLFVLVGPVYWLRYRRQHRLMAGSTHKPGTLPPPAVPS